MAFSKAAPKKVKEDGAIYIITGPNTFSAAIVNNGVAVPYSSVWTVSWKAAEFTWIDQKVVFVTNI